MNKNYIFIYCFCHCDFYYFEVFELLCRVSKIKNFNIMLEYTLFLLLFLVYMFIIYYNLNIIIQFCKKGRFFPIIFPLELSLPITTDLVYVLKIYYIFEKSLPVEVWVKGKPFRFYLSGNMLLLLYMSY